jgi:membrane protease subunit HflK
LLEEYEKAPKVTRDRMYIDAMQSVLSNTTKVMIDVDNGNNLMLLPLDQMMQNSSRSSSLNDILKRQGDDNE